MKIVTALIAFAAIVLGGPTACGAQTPKSDTAAAQYPTNAPHKTGPVGTVRLVNDSGRTQTAKVVTFGQIFTTGSVRPGDALQVVVNGQPLPTQTDSKALYPNGSVRHAVMSVELPQVRPGQAVEGTIVNGQGDGAGAASGYVAIPNLSVAIDLKDGAGATRRVQLSLPAIAADPKAAAPKAWLQGALGQERRFRADVDDRLQVVFDVFTPRSGAARVDVIFHNDWNTTPQSETLLYDVQIQLDGASVFKARDIEHYAFSTWHRLISTDDLPPMRVVPDLRTLTEAAAVPRYDPAFQLGGFYDDIAAAAQAVSGEPLSSGTVTRAMPTTGGRMDIGPLPAWAVADLLRSDSTTRKLLMANGDAAGSVPWHIREKETGLPLTIDKYPELWLDSRGGHRAPLASHFSEQNNGWVLDAAHQPSLSYVPYLLTGLQYYRDELSQQAAYVLLSYDNDYRGGERGLIIGKDGEAWAQIRGMAWSFRTLATAAYILPADDPMRPYFDAKLKGNLAKLVDMFVVNRRLKGAGELEGWVPGIYRPEEAVAPWQQGFLTIILGWANEMGYADAGRMIGWTSPFLTGLFTSEDKGYARYHGPAYILIVRDTETKDLLTTWADAHKASIFDRLSAKDKADAWSFYGMIMRGALGSAYAVNKSPKTREAFDYVSGELARTRGTTTRGDPTFAIVPPALSAR